jgi:hypothetical protein
MIINPHKWRDVAWKKAITDGVLDAIAYFMPDLAADMDTSREVISISGAELPVIGADTDKGMRVTDVFLDVPVRGGDNWSIACLIEQQHENDNALSTRLFDSFISLRGQRPPGRTTIFVIYTGDSKNVNFYIETGYGIEVTLKFRTFHLPSYDVEELRRDNNAFARVMYAGLMAYKSGDDVALREKYAMELLNLADEISYDNRQKKLSLISPKGYSGSMIPKLTMR